MSTFNVGDRVRVLPGNFYPSDRFDNLVGTVTATREETEVLRVDLDPGQASWFDGEDVSTGDRLFESGLAPKGWSFPFAEVALEEVEAE